MQRIFANAKQSAAIAQSVEHFIRNEKVVGSSPTRGSKIKAIYGNYGFWSWLRYWHLDSADFVMLMDKGYYDYDYNADYSKRREKLRQLRPKSNAELQETLTRMGFGNIMAKDTPLSPAEIQAVVMAEEKKKGAAL